MSINIRYPNISGISEKEQLAQIKSYLHQLVEQLNYALQTLGTGDGNGQSAGTYEVQGGELSYYELRSLIIQEIEDIGVLFEKLSLEMKNEYVRSDEVDSITTQVAEKISFTMDEDGNLYYEVEE